MRVSDTALTTTRGRVAAAAAPEAGGKNPDRTLYALDGSDGTLDPAFEAHSGPLKYWALAWWEQWFNTEQLTTAFTQASLKLDTGRQSWWNVQLHSLRPSSESDGACLLRLRP